VNENKVNRRRRKRPAASKGAVSLHDCKRFNKKAAKRQLMNQIESEYWKAQATGGRIASSSLTFALDSTKKPPGGGSFADYSASGAQTRCPVRLIRAIRASQSSFTLGAVAPGAINFAPNDLAGTKSDS